MHRIGTIGKRLKENLRLVNAKHSFPHSPHGHRVSYTRRNNEVKGIGVDDIGNCKLDLIQNSMINIPNFVWFRDAGEHGGIQAYSYGQHKT